MGRVRDLMLYASGKRRFPIPYRGRLRSPELIRSPFNTLNRFLHRLKKGGVIKSIRGPRGGYLLSKSPSETNLREILYATEGTTFDLICESNPLFQQCNDTDIDCGLKGVWAELREKINSFLEAKSLEHLLKQTKNFTVEDLVAIGRG